MKDKGYNFIRFVGTLLIVLWHYCSTSIDLKLPILYGKDLLRRGNIGFATVGVGIFFILSGALLHHNYKDKIDIKSFYKKRLVRIYIPIFISYIFLFGLTYIFNPSIIYFRKISILLSFFGLDFFGELLWNTIHVGTLWLVGEWFTTVILIIYLLFPLLRKLFIKHFYLTTILISIIFLVNLKLEFLTYGNGYYSITNGIMYFWIGMIFDKYKDYIKKYIFIPIIICLLLLIINPKDIFGFWYLYIFIFSASIFIILYQIKISNKFIDYICKYNYDIYLLHHRIFIIVMPLILVNCKSISQLILAFIFINLLVCVTSEKLNLISNKISNKILKKH